MNKLLQMKNIQRFYSTPAGIVKALDGINIEIYEGERVILLGPSGSGKTTLLNCFSALDSPTGGSYVFQGSEVPRNKSE
jgi:putative ABC transport system ATP-binding protein